MFYTLSQAICSCTMAVDSWKKEMMNQVLEQLIQIPSTWKKDNVAGFLLFCSEKVIWPRHYFTTQSYSLCLVYKHA